MPFNKEEHYGFALGGPTHGMFVQGGKMYDNQGREVGVDGKPLKAAAKQPVKQPEKVEKTEAEKQVLEQGNV